MNIRQKSCWHSSSWFRCISFCSTMFSVLSIVFVWSAGMMSESTTRKPEQGTDESSHSKATRVDPSPETYMEGLFERCADKCATRVESKMEQMWEKYELKRKNMDELEKCLSDQLDQRMKNVRKSMHTRVRALRTRSPRVEVLQIPRQIPALILWQKLSLTCRTP